MKRTLSIILTLTLLLGVLPAAVHAGGDVQVIWAEDLNSPNALRDWEILDANHDGYGFVKFWPDPSGAYAASPLAIDESGEKGSNSDEYLISPPVKLPNAAYEYELTFSSQVKQGNGQSGHTFLRVLILEADAPLTEASLSREARKGYATDLLRPAYGWEQMRCDLTAWAGKTIRLAFNHYDSSDKELWLDDFRITEYAPDDHINRITVLNLPEPEIGKRVTDLDPSGIQIVQSHNLSLVPGSLQYFKTVEEQLVPLTDDVFEVGVEYDARFLLAPAEDSFTYGDAIVSVNGRQAIYYSHAFEAPDMIQIDVPFGRLQTPSSCTVTFLNAHGYDPASQRVNRGECAEAPAGLTAEDYLFLGWCTDPECKAPFDFSTPVTGNLILYSKWLYMPGGVKLFDDAMDPAKYYYEPVYWAVAKGITTGTSETRFSPDAPCTRAQVVTFLWRAAGEPAPGKTGNPFRDVAEGQYYSDAVLWAVEEGITTGTGPDTFRPDAACTRGQIVTFLWRYRGSPDPLSPKTAFTDVSASEFYAKPVAWAVENDVTKGKSAESFAPGDVCTRAQIVTFLFRAMSV